MYRAIRTGEAENPEDRVGLTLNYCIMKKIKKMAGASAFIFAIALAFAFSNVNADVAQVLQH